VARSRTTQRSRDKARLVRRSIRSDSTATGGAPWGDIFICLALALATVACYKNLVNSGFVNLDDDYYVTRNPWVQMGLSRPSVHWAFTTMAVANWHPLTWLSLELDYQLFGPAPAGFHATNLVLHVANTLLLYWLLRRWTGAAGRSACVAAFFSLHPLHVESVAWITERKDVLSTLFLLLSLLAWQVYVRRAGVGAYAASLTLFILSLMAKPMGITLPLLLLLLDFWPLARGGEVGPNRTPWMPSKAMLVAEKLPFFLVSAACAAVTVLAQGHGGALAYGRSLSLADRLLAVPVNYLIYLRQTLWPAGLAVFYRHPGGDLPMWQPLAAAVVLALVTISARWLRQTRPYLTVGWFWFLISLLPVIGLVQTGAQATADRYMYLPMIGLLIGACWGGWDLAVRWRCREVLVLAATICLLACAGLTFRQVATWHDSVTLWQRAVSVAPPAVLSFVNYASALKEAGMTDEAQHWYREALAIDPDDFAANSGLGIVLSNKGHQEEAERHLLTALKSRPKHPLLLENLGIVKELQGHLDAAVEYYQLSAGFDPQSPRIQQHLQRVRQKQAAGPSQP